MGDVIQGWLQAGPEIFERFIVTPAQLSALLAGGALLVRVTWFLTSEAGKRIERWHSWRREVYKVAFGRSITREKYLEASREIIGFFCLIVRYGSDDYLSRLGSDEERNIGRLQNKVVKINFEFDLDGNAHLVLELPVHKRLGTQFKCFVEVREGGDAGRVKSILDNCDQVSDVTQSHSQQRSRFFFHVNTFSSVLTVEGVRNDMVFPN